MATAMRLEGDHAVVTGAGSGIGRATAIALAGEGAAVTLVGRTESTLAETAATIEAEGGRAWARPGDVTDAEAVEAIFDVAEADGPVDVLVTAAGTNVTGPAADYSVDDWDALFDVNVRGTFAACRAAGRRMLARGDGGRIVTISSQMGSVGFPGRVAYCATKHAVDGMTKALAVEWAPHGITVNAVAPTFLDTPLTKPMFEDAEFAAEVARRIPGGEIAQLSDVTEAVLYLASPAARAVTGHVLAVDRGWTAW
jgi:NAD(P)-dependent dehydrogenase (short-subunit alcohol dehydrogenase family)